MIPGDYVIKNMYLSSPGFGAIHPTQALSLKDIEPDFDLIEPGTVEGSKKT